MGLGLVLVGSKSRLDGKCSLRRDPMSSSKFHPITEKGCRQTGLTSSYHGQQNPLLDDLFSTINWSVLRSGLACVDQLISPQ